MVESACRSLRDGLLQGEFAPALMLCGRCCPYSSQALLLHLLRSLLSNIAAGTAQPKFVVFVAAERSPVYYHTLLNIKDEELTWIHYVDCFRDPLGWRTLVGEVEVPEEVGEGQAFCHDLGDLNGLLSLILQSSNGRVSSMIWVLHANLHEERTAKSLEYMSSMILSVEPEHLQGGVNGSCDQGTLRLRQKRRNGRIREQVERFKTDEFAVTFFSNKMEAVEAGKINVAQLQFKLDLSDKERTERAKVILPFEHQGNGRESLIYNGRQEPNPSVLEVDAMILELNDLDVKKHQGHGQVNYLRDSDDERPDSDEDPDDDLDI